MRIFRQSAAPVHLHAAADPALPGEDIRAAARSHRSAHPGPGNLNGDVNLFLSAERGSIEPGTSDKTSMRFRIDRHSEYSRRKGTPTGGGMAVGTRLVIPGCPPGASLQGLERGQAVLNTRPRLGRRLEACSWRRNVAPSPAPPMQTWLKPQDGPAFCV